MRTFESCMSEYAESHRNPLNIVIHKICVPLIMFSVVGVLWCIPVPGFLNAFPWLNWAVVFVTVSLLFYLSLNFVMFLGMLLQVIVMCFICHHLFQSGALLQSSIVIFISAWIGQFWGHKIEGKKPSFLKDLIFLLIGPLWVQRFFFEKLGINFKQKKTHS